MKSIKIEISELNLIKALAKGIPEVCVVHDDKVIIDLAKLSSQEFYFKVLGKLYKLTGYSIDTADENNLPEITLQRVY